MIAFVDIPPGTRFLPQAAELNDGQVVTFFSPLIEKLKRDGGTPPVAYPETTTTDEGRRERDAYSTGSPTTGMPTRQSRWWRMSSAQADGPCWIAYRVIFGSGETVHLDVSARGDYDTGTFAYYFIRRGERHGLRIVASMKSEPALNLLAAYDK